MTCFDAGSTCFDASLSLFRYCHFIYLLGGCKVYHYKHHHEPIVGVSQVRPLVSVEAWSCYLSRPQCAESHLGSRDPEMPWKVYEEIGTSTRRAGGTCSLSVLTSFPKD